MAKQISLIGWFLSCSQTDTTSLLCHVCVSVHVSMSTCLYVSACLSVCGKVGGIVRIFSRWESLSLKGTLLFFDLTSPQR